MVRRDGRKASKEATLWVTAHGYMAIRKHVDRSLHGNQKWHWSEVVLAGYKLCSIVHVKAGERGSISHPTFQCMHRFSQRNIVDYVF